METKINIAAILKDKPQGTKLYDWLHNIDVELDTISTTDTEIVVWCTNETNNNTTCHRGYSEFGTERGYPDGLQILFPSKEMRDWTKFSWKKGDVLVNSRGLKILFDRWANDNYTSFYAKTINLVEDAFLDTNLHTLASEKEAKSFIKCIEEKLGGKLNLETLEIEKQHEFKDGDIVVVDKNEEMNLAKIIAIYNDGDTLLGFNSYAYLNVSLEKLNFCSEVLACGRTPRLASEEEKQQLFDALAKEGKRWNPDTKLFEDLPKKCEFKPFDKVLVRDSGDEEWKADFFSHNRFVDVLYYRFSCVGNMWRHCIPYNEETKHLLGTTDEWKG
jgi:hypothetical protein